MEPFPVGVGDKVSVSKTVGEYDVYGFAGITGDFAPNHVNEEYMRESGYSARIAHGALLVGYSRPHRRQC
ncbi:MAG: MaoC/PaaZ C-terminal domain-containing protein [Chloroflexota bacterium]